MTWTKTKTAVAIGGALLLAAGVAKLIINHNPAAQKKIQTARTQTSTGGAAAVGRTEMFVRPSIQNSLPKAQFDELRRNVWPKEKRLEEERIKSRQKVDEAPGAVTIDLTPFINSKLADSPVAPPGVNDNNLGELPAGVNIYGGIRFDVEGTIQLGGKNLKQMFHKDYPGEVDNIPIGRRCAKIYLLHAANWDYPGSFGHAVAKLVLHYADGSTCDIDIISGKHVFDWWFPLFKTGIPPRFFQTAPGTERAWTGSNPFIERTWPGESVVLFRSVFENPQPEVEVRSLDYVSTMTQGVSPFMAGLTVE